MYENLRAVHFVFLRNKMYIYSVHDFSNNMCCKDRRRKDQMEQCVTCINNWRAGSPWVFILNKEMVLLYHFENISFCFRSNLWLQFGCFTFYVLLT